MAGIVIISGASDHGATDTRPIALPATLGGQPRVPTSALAPSQRDLPGLLPTWWPGRTSAFAAYNGGDLPIVNVIAVRGRFGDKGDLRMGPYGGTLSHVGPDTCVQFGRMFSCGRESDQLSVSVAVPIHSSQAQVVAMADQLWADLT